jgi:hypothetical protein
MDIMSQKDYESAWRICCLDSSVSPFPKSCTRMPPTQMLANSPLNTVRSWIYVRMFDCTILDRIVLPGTTGSYESLGSKSS